MHTQEKRQTRMQISLIEENQKMVAWDVHMRREKQFTISQT